MSFSDPFNTPQVEAMGWVTTGTWSPATGKGRKITDAVNCETSIPVSTGLSCYFIMGSTTSVIWNYEPSNLIDVSGLSTIKAYYNEGSTLPTLPLLNLRMRNTNFVNNQTSTNMLLGTAPNRYFEWDLSNYKTVNKTAIAEMDLTIISASGSGFFHLNNIVGF